MYFLMLTVQNKGNQHHTPNALCHSIIKLVTNMRSLPMTCDNGREG